MAKKEKDNNKNKRHKKFNSQRTHTKDYTKNDDGLPPNITGIINRSFAQNNKDQPTIDLDKTKIDSESVVTTLIEDEDNKGNVVKIIIKNDTYTNTIHSIRVIQEED